MILEDGQEFARYTGLGSDLGRRIATGKIKAGEIPGLFVVRYLSSV